MELQGETIIQASRQAVWTALNDPAVLARCIDGVETLEQTEPNRFQGVLNAKVGPVKAKFSGGVELTELDPPNRYVLVGEGKGGVAGFAKGSAEVVLTDADGGATRLAYVAKSQVGGKLAQLGTRLIEGAAKGYAESFFAAFKREVEEAVEPSALQPAPAATPAAQPAGPSAAQVQAEATTAAIAAVDAARPGLPGWVWIGGLVALVLAVLAMLY